MSKNNSLLYHSPSIPSGKYNVCHGTLSSSLRKYDHALKRTYTDEDISSNSSTTSASATCSLTMENLETHTKMLSLYSYSKFERIKSYVYSITPEIIQESDVYNLHEKELTDLENYEQETEPLNQHISNCLMRQNKKKKGWIGRLKCWIKLRKDTKNDPCSWSDSTVHEKDKKLYLIKVLDNGTSQAFVNDLESDEITRRPSIYSPRITSVPIERQPKFSPNINKRKCHIRTPKSSR